MNVRFQGIYVFEGREEAVKQAAKSQEKGTYVVKSAFRNGVGSKVVVNDTHAETFLRDEMNLTKPKMNFSLLHPIRSVKAYLQDIQNFAKQFGAALNNGSFERKLSEFLKKQEEAGEKFTRINADEQSA